MGFALVVNLLALGSATRGFSQGAEESSEALFRAEDSHEGNNIVIHAEFKDGTHGEKTSVNFISGWDYYKDYGKPLKSILVESLTSAGWSGSIQFRIGKSWRPGLCVEGCSGPSLSTNQITIDGEVGAWRVIGVNVAAFPDGRCGPRNPLADGLPSPCIDPKYPCCSSEGRCGNSPAHCEVQEQQESGSGSMIPYPRIR